MLSVKQSKVYIQRKPVIIASSAQVSNDVKDKCYGIGFDYVTGIPIEYEFITEIFKQIAQKRMMYDNNPQAQGFNSSNNFSEAGRMQLPIFRRSS